MGFNFKAAADSIQEEIQKKKGEGMQVRVIKSMEDLKAVMAELQGVPSELPKVSPETVTLEGLLERMRAAAEGIPTEEKPEEVAVTPLSTEEIVKSVNHKLPPIPEELWNLLSTAVKEGRRDALRRCFEDARESMKDMILSALKK